MRDTVRLRTRLALLACLPGLAPACDESSNAQLPSKAEARAATPEPAAASQESKATSPKQDASPPAAPEKLDPEEARLMPIDGDPPYIDGYNPEEDRCVSGNWCGTIETAMAIAPNPDQIATQMDCPVRIIGSHNPSPIEGPAYEGLSNASNMQGALNQHGTELARADRPEDTCCYHWFEYCSGRPLRDDERHVVAPIRNGSAWIDEGLATDPIAPPSPSVREALAQAWLRDGLAEHASIASFARVTLELMALGAPPELLAQTQQAGADEVAHARACFGLAARFGTGPRQPDRLPVLPPRAPDLATFAADTFLEGCVGESIAALMAERAAAACSDETTAQVLDRIAQDEARHAALAWRTIAWALETGGGPVRRALRSARDRLGPPTFEPEHAVDHPDWAAFGRLHAGQRQAAAEDAVRDIIRPMLGALLGEEPPAAQA